MGTATWNELREMKINDLAGKLFIRECEIAILNQLVEDERRANKELAKEINNLKSVHLYDVNSKDAYLGNAQDWYDKYVVMATACDFLDEEIDELKDENEKLKDENEELIELVHSLNYHVENLHAHLEGWLT
jgi:FtsZ-binding cell division protein ZapB